MRKAVAVLVCMFVTGVLASQTKTDSGLMKRANEFSAAVKAKDAAKVASLYTEEAVIMPPNEAMVKGRQNIQAFMQRQFDGGVQEVTFSHLESATSGATGYAAGTYFLSFKSKDGQAGTDNGKYMEIWKRVGGEWKIAYDIFNSDKPPMP
ncbi:MAG: YybH family protein [Vicinamibacterales bacterium]